jgi:hypothetical protein
MESSIIDMGIMKKGHLVTLSFDGVIRFFSQEQINDNERDDEIFEKQEKESNSDFILSSLYIKKIEEKSELDISTIEVLNDGRISIGLKLKLLIYEANNFEFSFDIPNYGPYQKALKNGYSLVITKQGEFDSFFSIIEIKEKTFNVLQTIETLFIESFEFKPRKTPRKFEEFSNGNLTVLCREYDDRLATGRIHFYEKKSSEFSLFATSKVTNCVYLHCFNEKKILFN